MNVQEFKDEKERRDLAIQTRLMDIRKAQIEYKNFYGFHAGSFDDLAKFLNEDKLPFVIKEGSLTDEQLEKGMTEAQAIKEGLIRRDTTWVLAKDTLFGPGFNASLLANVPVEGVNARFKMDTATISSGSGYTVKVFEASVLYDTYLGDLDRQELINLKDKMSKMGRFEGLRVGSVTEINNNAGNWE
jgi:hypothetical protein